MNYELYKKLKDAGYPQIMRNGGFLAGDIETDEGGIVTNNSVYVPTLSELIEACGPQFGKLIQRDKEQDVPDNQPTNWNWCAESKTYWGIASFASTPEEAVAMLYLALKSNDKN